MAKIVLVLLGGAFRTGLRYLLSILILKSQRTNVPLRNSDINISGSVLIGILAELFEARVLVAPVARVALLTGVLGGYTTFSSFTFETVSLLRDGQMFLATLNVSLSIVLGLAAVWIGMRLVNSFRRVSG